MAKLGAFTFVSLDGYLAGPGGDIGWAKVGGEQDDLAAGSLQGGHTLLFGRATYAMMAGWWPTPQAAAAAPAVAAGMNAARKLVFSRTLKSADWANTTVVPGDAVDEARQLKRSSETDMVLLGSGSILTQFAAAGLVDSFEVMIHPVALGRGTAIFAGLPRALDLRLKTSRALANGAVLLTYEPAKAS